MKKIYSILNILLILAVLIGDYCYNQYGTLRLKSTVSAGFVLIGAVNLSYAMLSKRCGLRFPAAMLAGLVLAMLGDVFLGIHFIAGVALFATGHVLYFASFCVLQKPRPRDAVPIAAMFVIALMILYLTPSMGIDDGMGPLLTAYALIISAMTGKAISNWLKERTPLNAILAIGSAMFYFSDAMLVLHMFADVSRIADTLCLATYYPAQCLLGYSIYRFVESERTGARA